MKYFLRKDLIIFFNSAIGYVIISAFLLALSLMLWLFRGEHNIPDGGYATLSPFFFLASILLILFVPAITMKLFSEERKLGTIELLFFRPYSTTKIVLAKYFSSCILLLIALLPTLIYVYSVNLMSVSGVDMGEVTGGYLALVCLVISLSAIGVFTSSLTSNQLVSFLVAVVISFIFLFGFDLFAGLYSDGSLHNNIVKLGMYSHYQSMMRGVIDSRDLIYFIVLTLFFIITTIFVNSRYKNLKLYIRYAIYIGLLITVSIFSQNIFFRIDVTEERKYTISDNTKELINSLDQPLKVVSYLNGELNPAFSQLRSSMIDMLEELTIYTGEEIILTNLNLNNVADESIRQRNYSDMESKGMKGIAVNERDRDGKITSNVIFPWIEFIYGDDTIAVDLLKKNINLSSREILNSSMEEMEYTLTDAIRSLTMKDPLRIAFIEGHEELNESEVHEATELLSKYYNVDRGGISGDPAELLPYSALIIASPKVAFSEYEKYALDQYLMHGGSIFFLIDGIQISNEEFDLTGESATLKRELNLDDLLFTYGVKINPVVIQDINCTSIRLASSQVGAKDSYVISPWYFAPLLETSKDNLITRNISPLKSELVSTITWVGNKNLQKTILLTSSSNAHTLPVPEKVSLRYVDMPANTSYFNESYLPVGGLIQGIFPSVFQNRGIPAGGNLSPDMRRKNESIETRIMVIASSSIIRNDWIKQGNSFQPLPLGYDQITQEQLGNGDFIVNAVNYLTGNEKWLDLRSRNYKLRLLNKQDVTTGLIKWQIINIGVPVLLILIGGIIFYLRRKNKYKFLQ